MGRWKIHDKEKKSTSYRNFMTITQSKKKKNHNRSIIYVVVTDFKTQCCEWVEFFVIFSLEKVRKHILLFGKLIIICWKTFPEQTDSLSSDKIHQPPAETCCNWPISSTKELLMNADERLCLVWTPVSPALQTPINCFFFRVCVCVFFFCILSIRSAAHARYTLHCKLGCR